MQVRKRDGSQEACSPQVLLDRVRPLAAGLDEVYVNIPAKLDDLVEKVVSGLPNGVSTEIIDELLAETAASLTTHHPDWGLLAGRLAVTALHKKTPDSFFETMTQLRNYINPKTGRPAPLVHEDLYQFLLADEDRRRRIDAAVDHRRDWEYDYFGFKTLEKSYLLRIDGEPAERPQHLLMRVAAALYASRPAGMDGVPLASPLMESSADLVERIVETYDLLSNRMYTHATPTLFNAGTVRPQLSSCFLLTMADDSIAGIYDTLKQCAQISQFAGGIGLSVSTIRAKGSYIAGTNGTSNGLVPMLRVFNDTARYVDQCFYGATEVLVGVREGSDANDNSSSAERPVAIPMSRLQVGDRVLTHTGAYKPIEKVVIHPADVRRSMVRLVLEQEQQDEQADGDATALPTLAIEVTAEHPFFAIPAASMSDADIAHRLDLKLAGPEWIDAAQLRPNDRVAFRPMCASDHSRQQPAPHGPSYCKHGYEFVRVLSVETGISAAADQPLYDLEVCDDHSYVTATGGIVHNGGGRRKGSIAIYLEPWHSDVFEFLNLKKNHGKEEVRARDLFYALWIPDLFMKRVEQDGEWSLFCPNEAPGLVDVWGADFDRLYERYEKEGRARRSVRAQELWFAILEAQVETGTPYLLYKDAANRKSNQQNLGTIRSSNLCTEVIEFCSPDEVAVCNLASIALPRFVKLATAAADAPAARSTDRGSRGDEESSIMVFDYDLLHRVTRIATRNLNRVIDINYYPIPEARRSNLRHRPVGLGVQGLADVFMKLGIAFESDAAREVNRLIFETIYHAALTESCALAESLGAPYETYSGSPISKGLLQFDMWTHDEASAAPAGKLSGRFDWESLRSNIRRFGVRNSLLVAPMPTASTSQILGNNEAFEPYTSNIYLRRVLAGEFPVVNQHLVRDLVRLRLWSEQMRTEIIAANGSVQGIAQIPAHLQERYRTAWEIKQRCLVDYAADRGCFIDQSQSLNLFVAEPTAPKLSSMHFYAWRKGLKTGMYYLRSRPAIDAIKFTMPSVAKAVQAKHAVETAAAESGAHADAGSASTASVASGPICTMQEGCVTCSS